MVGRSLYRWSTDRSLFDHSSKFEARFAGRSFSSYDDFKVQLRQFEEECRVHYRVRSSSLSGPGDPCRYTRLTLVCIYSDLETASQSFGIRKRMSKSRGCRARFSLYQRNGLLVVGEKSNFLIHNHRCSEMEYRVAPVARRLTSSEKSMLEKYMLYGVPSWKVPLLARAEYNKWLSRRDVWHVRSHLMDGVVPAETWGDFREVVCANGRFACSRDVDGKIECISFRRNEQAELFARYPEVLCVDATYKVNRSRFCLLQFVVTDGLGHGRPVMYSLMRNERCSTYATAFIDFRNLMPSVRKLQTFMVDMSYAQLNAIRMVFPEKKVLLCQFHMLRAIHRKTKDRVIWHFVKRMMATTSTTTFKALCQRLRRKFPGFYIYFCRVWLRHSRRWAVCQRSGTVCLGNQTNNRAESSHRWLKVDLCAGDTLLTCCKRIWVSSHQMLVDYMVEVAMSRVKRPIVSFNNPLSGVVRRLTRYAALRVLKEWESSTDISMTAIGVRPVFRVVEFVSTRRRSYKVDLNRRHWSCTFNQYHAMPCRHLVFACMRAKVALDTLLVNSRWLDVNLDGVDPPELTFSPPPRPQPQVTVHRPFSRRVNRLSRTMHLPMFKRMVDHMDTVADLFEKCMASGECSSHSSTESVQPLRKRIKLRTSSETTTLPLPTPTLPSGIVINPSLWKAPPEPGTTADLDEANKENIPTPSTSHTSKWR